MTKKIKLLSIGLISFFAFICILFGISTFTPTIAKADDSSASTTSSNNIVESNIIRPDTFDFIERSIDYDSFNVVGKYLRISWSEPPLDWFDVKNSSVVYSFRGFSSTLRFEIDDSTVVNFHLPSSIYESFNFNYLDVYFPVGTFIGDEFTFTMPNELYIDENSISSKITIKEIYKTESTKTYYFDDNYNLPDTSDYVEEDIKYSNFNLVNRYLRIYINKIEGFMALQFKDSSYMLFYTTELVYVDPTLNCRYIVRYTNIKVDSNGSEYYDFYFSSGTYESNGVTFTVPDELYASSYNPNYTVKLLTPPEDDGGDTGNGDNTGTVTPGGDNNNSGGSSTGNGSSGTNQNKTNINANGQEFKMLLGVGLVIGLFAGLYAVANSFTPKKTRRARR